MLFGTIHVSFLDKKLGLTCIYTQDMDELALAAKPNIHCHFAGGLGESRYLPLTDWEALVKLLTEALANYNELVGAMQLVLFEDAMMHVCR